MSAISLYARETPGFADRVAHAAAVLQSAATDHAGRVVQATSLGAEDMVVTDLIARHARTIALGTLETGALHAQTVDLISTISARYALPVEVYRPQAEAVVQFVKANGPEAMYRSLDLRKACCGVRKMEPLGRLLTPQARDPGGAAIEQSSQGLHLAHPTTGLTLADGTVRTKINPLADWSWADVWHYIQLHEVPYNALHDVFFPSIGCEPCTRAVSQGEDFRAGRWWWEVEDAKECGLHVSHAPINPVKETA